MNNQNQSIYRVFQALNQRELSLLDEVLHPDAVFHFPGTQPLFGSKKIVRFMKLLFRMYPKLEFTTGRVAIGNTCMAVEWTNSGLDRKGIAYENAGVTFIEQKNGKIVYMSDTFKDTAKFISR